jgi:signal peptidase II
MANTLWQNGLSEKVKTTSPFMRLGLLVAALVFGADQLSKYCVLNIINLDEREPLQITPFLDLAMAWNKGVSYGLLTTQMQLVLVALSVIITIGLVFMLRNAAKPLLAASYGLLIGGALGNALDRVLHGAVADFVHLHWGTASWYIFNVADIAIVAGVAALIYDALLGEKRS